MTHCIAVSYDFVLLVISFPFSHFIRETRKCQVNFPVTIIACNHCNIHRSYACISSVLAVNSKKTLWHRPMMNSFPTRNFTSDNKFRLFFSSRVKQYKWFPVPQASDYELPNEHVLRRVYCSYFPLPPSWKYMNKRFVVTIKKTILLNWDKRQTKHCQLKWHDFISIKT